MSSTLDDDVAFEEQLRAQLRPALNDDSAAARILATSPREIEEVKRAVLDRTTFARADDRTKIEHALRNYTAVCELDDFTHGAYLRWIPLTKKGNDNNNNNNNAVDVTAALARGGHFCDVSITDAGCSVRCRSMRSRYFQFTFDNHLVFQKLSNSEMILLAAMRYVNS